ncbi:MAG: DUF1298 domain-containing protein [Myxococcales bacterium]|nr:DUF1298 domain-containing protein [Myxococcales bacterium]
MQEGLFREPMSPVDATWLSMEDPTNLMMISGVMQFARPVEREALRETLLQRLAMAYPRFRQRVVEPALGVGAPYWEEVADFSIDDHLEELDIPAPYDRQTYQEQVSALLSVPLDRNKPLWSVHLLREQEEIRAVFVRVHHCIADGIALVVVLLSMTELADIGPDVVPSPTIEVEGEESAIFDPAFERADSSAQIETESLFERLRSLGDAARQAMGSGVFQAARSASEQVVDQISKHASGIFQQVRDLSSRVVEGGKDMLKHPEQWADQARIGAQGLLSPIRLLLDRDEPQTRFRGKLGIEKKVAWSRPLPLDDIKALKASTQGTVNDILMAAMAGALRRYLLLHGEDINGIELRAAIPVNLRPIEEAKRLGNAFGLVFVQLPVGEEVRNIRLVQVKTQMDELKRSPEALVTLGLLRAVGFTPAEIKRWFIEIFGRRITCVMTNVPGPQQPLSLAGQPLDTLMFWVPQTGRLGLGISILSYAGSVRLGIAVDAGLIDDPDAIVEAFYEEIESMRLEAGLL